MFDNSNTIRIPLVSVRGGVRYEFDYKYPNGLDGIISRSEFTQSIFNVNQPLTLRKTLGFFGVFICLFVLSGIILCIVGGVTSSNSSSNFPLLIAIGIGLIAFGIVFCIPGFCLTKYCYSNQLKQAVAMESERYSNKCSWHLIGSSVFAYQFNCCGSCAPPYQILIQISGEEKIFYESNPKQQQKTNYFMQKSQVTPTNVQFCSQCGKPRQNLNAKFCSSCGQSLN